MYSKVTVTALFLVTVSSFRVLSHACVVYSKVRVLALFLVTLNGRLFQFYGRIGFFISYLISYVRSVFQSESDGLFLVTLKGRLFQFHGMIGFFISYLISYVRSVF